MSQCESLKFRNTVSEIYGQYPKLLTKQHALRVKSDA